MRILCDTNVLIASLIANGVCHELLEGCFVNHDLVVSEFILEELREKLIDKFKYSAGTSANAVQLFRSRMEIAIPVSLDAPVSRDPDDDNILAAALAGRCDIIISGDKDLLELQRFGDILILSPRQFMDLSG